MRVSKRRLVCRSACGFSGCSAPQLISAGSPLVQRYWSVFADRLCFAPTDRGRSVRVPAVAFIQYCDSTSLVALNLVFGHRLHVLDSYSPTGRTSTFGRPST